MKKLEHKVPNLRFKDFTDDWEQRKLGDLMNVTSVKRIHQSDWQSEGIPFFRARDIVALNKGEKISEPLYISKEKYEDYSRISGKVKYNDLLVTGVGTIGIPFLVRKTPLYFKDGNIIWFQNNNKINGYFLYISFLTSSMQDYIRSSTGVGTVPTYTIKSGKETPIKYPISIEQDKITATIKRVSDIVTLQQRKLELLKQLKKGFLQKMFAEKNSKQPILRFKGFHDDWEQRKLGETVFVNSGKDYKGLQKGNIPVYGTGGYMLSVNKYLSNKDAIGIGRKGTINNPYILKAPFWTVDTLFYAIPQNQSDIEFMNAIFQNVNWHKYDESTGVPSLSKSTINQVKVYTTSLREQAAIGSLLHKIEKTISLQHQKLAKYQSIKKSLLQQMFI